MVTRQTLCDRESGTAFRQQTRYASNCPGAVAQLFTRCRPGSFWSMASRVGSLRFGANNAVVKSIEHFQDLLDISEELA
jgi:hypothetical protein